LEFSSGGLQISNTDIISDYLDEEKVFGMRRDIYIIEKNLFSIRRA
jgi:hypothetical protein